MDETGLIIDQSFPENVIVLLPALPPKAQLDWVLELLSAADECAERLSWLTTEAWKYLVANKLWRAGSMTEEEVKEKINWPAVKERMEKFLVT